MAVPLSQELYNSYLEADTVLKDYDYQDALDIQYASNLSGVVFSFYRMMDKINEEARHRNQGTNWRNNHPIARMFAETISSLSGGGAGDYSTYQKAYDICVAKTKAKE